MKVVSAAVLATAMTVAAVPAKADVLDLSTITCGDFIQSNEQTIGNLLMWLSGYYTEDGDPTVIDGAKMEETGKQLGAYCATNPTMGLLTAAEQVMGPDE